MPEIGTYSAGAHAVLIDSLVPLHPGLTRGKNQSTFVDRSTVTVQLNQA